MRIPKADLDELPDQILQRIIGHISRNLDLKSCTQVCRRFCAFVKIQLWHTPQFNPKMEPENLTELAHLPVRVLDTRAFMRHSESVAIKTQWCDAIALFGQLEQLTIGPLGEDLHKQPTPDYLLKILVLKHIYRLETVFDIERGYGVFMGNLIKCLPALDEIIITGQIKYPQECTILMEAISTLGGRVRRLTIPVTDQGAGYLPALTNLRHLSVTPYTTNVNLYTKSTTDSIKIISDGLCQLPSLKDLQFAMVCRSACGELVLKNLPNLRSLSVHGFEISNMDAAYSLISDINNITELELSHLEVEGAVHLARLTNLRKLIFTGSCGTLASILPELVNITSIQSLQLDEIDTENLRYLRRFRQLTELRLRLMPPYPKASADNLASCTQLRTLVIENIYADVCGRLWKLPHLRHLHLSGASGDREKMAQNVGKCQHLLHLSIETNIGGCSHLRNLPELTQLVLTPTEELSDDACRNLLSMPKLRKLEMRLFCQLGNTDEFGTNVDNMAKEMCPQLEFEYKNPENFTDCFVFAC